MKKDRRSCLNKVEIGSLAAGLPCGGSRGRLRVFAATWSSGGQCEQVLVLHSISLGLADHHQFHFSGNDVLNVAGMCCMCIGWGDISRCGPRAKRAN